MKGKLNWQRLGRTNDHRLRYMEASGQRQKSCTARVPALTLFSEGSPVLGTVGPYNSLLGLHGLNFRDLF